MGASTGYLHFWPTGAAELRDLSLTDGSGVEKKTNNDTSQLAEIDLFAVIACKPAQEVGDAVAPDTRQKRGSGLAVLVRNQAGQR